MDLFVYFAASMVVCLVALGALIAADIREPVPVASRPPLTHRRAYRPVHRL